jgi:uncharacterized surface protein with fasciclin (FAS1) repeats
MKDIIQTAIDAGTFTNLVAAVKAAGLVDTLNGPGPFTVLAPNDNAFAKHTKEEMEKLLADKSLLTSILTYHVIAGKFMSTDVAKLKSAKTVNGKEVKISVNGGVKIDDAKVISADIECSNGVIHVIDTVLMP